MNQIIIKMLVYAFYIPFSTDLDLERERDLDLERDRDFDLEWRAPDLDRERDARFSEN